ncbi:hypothetical protein [Wolbachia endosymbiont (group A) of Rhinocyllus conicus]|uniref:hypothetical protein n=1 Tax=Wolbachia endosymbiont (group A) of Rhinocyllus conicus TaxID=2954053 RepID=UPI00222637F1|nr:hypothetical protein [Wolbachia endosymbiont (group A) of Rhinocyllus conicus]
MQQSHPSVKHWDDIILVDNVRTAVCRGTGMTPSLADNVRTAMCVTLALESRKK